MVLLAKILIIISTVGLLRSFERFRIASRELDDQAIAALKQFMNVSEEMGIPRAIAPVLLLMTFVCAVMSMYAIEAALR